MYYKNTHGVLMFYDMTRYESFAQLPFYLEQMKRYCSSDCIAMLIGTKSDLKNQIQVSSKEAKEFAEKHNMSLYETSSKTGENLEEATMELARSCVSLSNNPQDIQINDTVDDYSNIITSISFNACNLS
eukprot:TRINITY_DN2371_c0_g1_i2.p1 TRINITY_DN2371_c0_g1~~TRINITY_DN2371_c0_g1_i2.p1  ORF type:complete len:129 (+),score=20.35 TRINITY_DN2371_c0_g1_i2:257-643(+)